METHKEEASSDDDYDKVESMAGSGIREHVQYTEILKYFHQELFRLKYFQSKLNCEVLSQEVGLEVRWSLAGDSAIIQIVGNLGQ